MEKIAGRTVNRAGKRGVFAILSVLLLTSVLLGLALPLLSQQGTNWDVAVQLAAMDRATDKFTSMEDQVAAIVTHYINITVDGGTVTFREMLPLDISYAEDLENFALFEQNFSDLNVSFNFNGIKNGSFVIQPEGVRVIQNQNFFNITANNSSGASIMEYEIVLVFPTGSVDAAAWSQLANVSENSTDALNVSVLIEDEEYILTNETGIYQGFSATINRSAASKINITMGNTVVAYIAFNPPSSLAIYSTSSVDLKALTRFKSQVYVEANSTMSVNSLVNRSAAVRVS